MATNPNPTLLSDVLYAGYDMAPVTKAELRVILEFLVAAQTAPTATRTTSKSTKTATAED